MSLARTQALSLVTKGVTTVLGIVQTLIVVRLLTSEQFGLVGLVTSIGGLVGATQHLGVVDGAIREIAVLNNKDDVAKAHWVSHIIRQVVTIPLSLALLLLAGWLATDVYGRPDIIPYIQIFAGILVLQGLQDVLGATLTGIKQFGALYIIQIITAVINIAAFGFLTWRYQTSGYFAAIVVTTIIMVALFWIVLARYLRGHLRWPRWVDVRRFGGAILSVSAWMYGARILFMVWQRLPLLLLGGVVAAEQLGWFTVALGFGSRLTIIGMALSEVNLSWMSSLFTQERTRFAAIVEKNMRRVLVLLAGVTMIILFFGPDVLEFVQAEYAPAHPVILVMALAFFLYAMVDVGTNSVFVPAQRQWLRTLLYVVMTLVTGLFVGWLLLSGADILLAAVGVLAGAVVAYVLMVILAKRSLGVTLLTHSLALLLIFIGASTAWLLLEPDLGWRVLVFVVLSGYIAWETWRQHLLPQRWEVFGRRDQSGSSSGRPSVRIICFAGAAYDAPLWTNRQHVMSRLSAEYPVLYVEPRVWIGRWLWDHRTSPTEILRFGRRLCWYEQRGEQIYVKAQWNLIPGSRKYRWIGGLNHALNRYSVLLVAWRLGLYSDQPVVWLYDTEAAEYMSLFRRALVVYDCVDDHAAQAGPDRNSQLVQTEEAQILARADLVTVTSRALYEQKRSLHANVHLVFNAGDVQFFADHLLDEVTLPDVLRRPRGPIIGSVGAIDSYKLDIELIAAVAQRHPDWQLVFIGQPVVDRAHEALHTLLEQPNVHILQQVPRESIPACVSRFDVCMIPYRANRYNAASFPLKFWEFMVTGKPVVVSGVPELKPFSTIIGYAESVEQFIDQVEQGLASPSLSAVRRRDLAFDHTWEKRVEQLRKLLEQTLRRSQEIDQMGNSRRGVSDNKVEPGEFRQDRNPGVDTPLLNI